MLDVMILNAYHRGDWLIEKYKGTQYAVETLDISDVVGVRKSADTLGPFGVVSDLDPDKREWFFKNHEMSEQKEGWMLWSNEGTFQSHGALTNYQLGHLKTESDSVLKTWMSVVDKPVPLHRSSPSLVETTLKPYFLAKKFLNEPEKRRTVKSGDSFSLTSAPSHKVIQWNEHTFDAHYVVSFLLPHELMVRSAVGLNQLLVSEPLKPKMCWQRARFKIETRFNLQNLPQEVCFVPQLREPLIEENFLILKKTSLPDEWDVWFRSWFDVHKEKKYFSQIQKGIVGALLSKLPSSEIICVEAPIETTEKMAYTLYPVYDLAEWSLETKFYSKGIFYGAQDKCETFSVNDRIDAQAKIFKQIDEELKGG